MSLACEVYLEVTGDDHWTAHLFVPLGCVAFGDSADEAVASLQRDLVAYRDWLIQHGEPAEDITTPAGLHVVELIHDVSPARASGEMVACFGPDREALSDGDLETGLRLTRYLRADLFRVVNSLALGQLSAPVTGSDRTIAEIARHVGQAECWYLTRLLPDDDQRISNLYDQLDSPLENLTNVLASIQEEIEFRLSRWSVEERNTVVTPTHLTTYGSEVWTAPKVVRRLIEHQREHLIEIDQLLNQSL